ncbi:MAG: enoyl-CoA hydratase [Ramlibacter sp.]|nr:enoyl-CoA hydratase [Ramlibacter sp.]
MTQENKTIIVERQGAVEILTLNRPDSLNALNPALLGELDRYFNGLCDREDVRVVLLKGSGRAFCAGADLKSEAFSSDGPGRTQRQMAIQRSCAGVIRNMRRCPQPIIALVHGSAAGGGMSLALASDLRILSRDARMNAAYIRAGLGGCDMGAGYFLTRLAGHSLATEVAFTGRFIGAERAQAAGLACAVVEQDALLETGMEYARDMLKAAPMGLRMTKESLNILVDAPSLEAALVIEDRQQVLLTGTADHREAVAAFLGRREARYTDT